MSTFLIHESNWERFEKKISSLLAKADKSHCTITYIPQGQEFKTCKDADGNEYIAKYYVVEVSGEAKYNGWRFVATLDHHAEGNVIRSFDTELAVPEKYKTCGPTCEHCNRIRSRKDTYLIYNEEKKEFKQVGKSCLQEFTNGLSAENIAFFCSIYEKSEAYGSYSGPFFNRYVEIESILPFAFECYKHWGYQKSESSYVEENGQLPSNYRSTRARVVDYYYINRCFQPARDRLRNEMDEVGFNAQSDYAKKSAKDALEWIRGLADKDITSEYIRNLHVICSDSYTDFRSLGILVSLTVAYARHLKQLEEYKEKEKAQEEMKKSEFVGSEGDRIDITTDDFTLVSSWEGKYGMTYLYKFSDGSSIFSWFSSKPIDDPERVVTVTGTVKSHNEYKAIKETILTRCKVTYKPEEPKEVPAAASNDVEEAVSQFLDYCNG